MSNSAADRLGHVAYVLLFAGQALLALHCPEAGWPLRAMGETAWVGIGLAMRMTSIALWGSLFLLIDLYGAFSQSL